MSSWQKWCNDQAKQRGIKKKKQGTPNKYGANQVEVRGIRFASKLESAVYIQLEQERQFASKAAKEDQRPTDIVEVQCQDQVQLTDACILYVPDFKVTLRNGDYEWHEAKGIPTQAFNIKKRLWEYYGPGPLNIWTGRHQFTQITQTIIPKTKKLPVPVL